MVGKPLAAILLLSFVLLVHSSDPCTQPIVTGPCRAYFPSVGYNAKENKCVEFVYGGCQGNGNRFETKEDCESKCVRKT